jgi:hypothetical protein
MVTVRTTDPSAYRYVNRHSPRQRRKDSKKTFRTGVSREKLCVPHVGGLRDHTLHAVRCEASSCWAHRLAGPQRPPAPRCLCSSWAGCAGAAVALRRGGRLVPLPALADAAGAPRGNPLDSAARPMISLPPEGSDLESSPARRGARRPRPRGHRLVPHTSHAPVTRSIAR